MFAHVVQIPGRAGKIQLQGFRLLVAGAGQVGLLTRLYAATVQRHESVDVHEQREQKKGSI